MSKAGIINYQKVFDTIYDQLPNNDGNIPSSKANPYTIKEENWYKTIPYAFRIIPDGDKSQSVYYFFPINPESISINTPYATAVTPTVGGIVEEHSGPVFYNISLSGTTGILPTNDIMSGVAKDHNRMGRPTVGAGTNQIKSNAAGGFGQNTINAINGIVSAITGTSAQMVDGARNRHSGYTAFHVLYKFFWLYHYGKANGAPLELKFMNYKDNNTYSCIVQNFQLQREKSRPHLYQYSIQLKAWKLSDTNQKVNFTNADRLKDLGLDESPSVKAELFRAINGTKTVLNGAAGLMKAAAGDLAF